MHEKRRHQRNSHINQVDYSDGQKFFQRSFVDIGTGGMFIRTRTCAPIGTMLTLCFQLDERPVRVEARTVRHTPEGMGVKFMYRNIREKELIREIMAQLVTTAEPDGPKSLSASPSPQGRPASGR